MTIYRLHSELQNNRNADLSIRQEANPGSLALLTLIHTLSTSLTTSLARP